MANSNDLDNSKMTPDPVETSARPLPSTEKTVKPNKVKYNNKYQWFHQMLLPMMAVGALLLALNVTFQNWLMHKIHQQQQEKIAQEIITLKQQQKDTNIHFDNTAKSLQALQLKLQTQIVEQNKDLQKALEQRLYQKQDWLLLKARYYLELAQINANWTDNQQTTIALLQHADSTLQDMSQQPLLQVRQAIAEQIANVKTLPAIDMAGLLSKIDALQAILPQLPLNQTLNDKKNTQTGAQKVSSSWRAKLQESLNLLEKLVVVRRNDDEGSKSIFSPMHQSLLRESIRMNLQEVQWAILQNNSTIYQHSLAQALKEVERIFDKNEASTQSFIKQLKDLQQIKLNVNRPVVDQPLLLLNKFIEAKSASDASSSKKEGGE